MRPTLVDTSVWKRYFTGRLSSEHVRWMRDLLDESGAVLVHPWVTGELVLGGLSANEEALLARLPAATEVEGVEVLSFVRARKIARSGIGWVDAQLLASALVDSASLWAIDTDLQRVAAGLKLQFAGTTD